jgi:hypothetical protein
MKTNRDHAYPVAKAVTEVAKRFEIKGEINQFTTQIDPIISNAMYNRELELLQNERFRTIIKLSKTSFTEEAILELITALNYKITI